MLLDTSGLLCCLDADEARHADAVNLYYAASTRLTHNYVLAELVALSRVRGLPRAASIAFVADMARDTEVELVWVDAELHGQALQLLQLQLDKSYSLCDAVSFLLMQQRGLRDALTTDRHFEQAGFHRLLPP